MYKIPKLYSKKTKKTLEEIYYNKFVQIYRDAISAMRTRRSWSKKIWGQPNKSIKLYLEPGSKADLFLGKCLNDDNFMKSLLIARPDEMPEIIKQVGAFVVDDKELKPIDEAYFLDIYNKQQSNQIGTVCHFLSSIHHVFVDTLYEKKLDKGWISKVLNFDYCPYCGNEEVSYTEFIHPVNGKTLLKPELDHFLPKSIYPFFAVSIFNLIPSCNTCNHKDLKGNYNPLLWDNQGNYVFRLMNPHDFLDEEITFAYVPPTEQHDLQIKCIIPNQFLNEGYNGVLAIESRYSHHKGDVRDMNLRMNNYLEMSILQYGVDTYKFEKDFIKMYPAMVLGFNPKDYKPWKKQRYKFLNDVFKQMSGMHGI